MIPILSIDFDRAACDTYRVNFPGVAVACEKVEDTIRGLPAADIIIGGPPCQSFSLAGKGLGEADPRNGWPAYLAAVAKVGPRMFLAENVAGMLTPKHLKYLARVYAEFEGMGYRVDWRKLDAVNFGVPQFRERIWVWGIRQDVQAVHQWPKATHAWPPPTAGLFGEHGLRPGVTTGQALHIWYPGCGWEGGPSQFVGIKRAGGKNSQQEKYGHTYGADEPSPTVSGMHGGGSGAGLEVVGYMAGHGYIAGSSREPIQNRKSKKWVRRLTPDECARLMSMPDDFRWPVGISKTAKYRIIGNGQASLMAWHMGQALRATDPESRTVISLFCGGGVGDVGFHGRYWSYER